MNENQLTVVEEYDSNKTDVLELDYFFDDIIKGCRNKSFHTFEYRPVHDTNFTKISNIEEINFTITHRSIKFETEFYGLNRKIKNARRNGFVFNQISILTVKFFSNLSIINVRYYLKFRIPIKHRQFFKLNGQNPDYLELFLMIWIIIFILHVRNGSFN